MPSYSYQCECGIRFDATVSMINHAKPQPCPSCHTMADRHLPTDVAGIFNLETSGVGPQNTGVSELDANLDRVIGEDSKKGWKAIEKRDITKNATLADNPGATSYDLSKNPDGSYRVMSEKERAVHARAFTINRLAHQSGKLAAQ